MGGTHLNRPPGSSVGTLFVWRLYSIFKEW
jgi:hypothetical protein